MRKRTKLEDVDWNQVQKEHDGGLFWLELVKRFNISRTLLYKARKNGLVTKIERKHEWSEEDKERISKQRTEYLKEHPEKVPYLLNHSSKESYPEKYFWGVFQKEGITLKRSKQVGLYQLDFYNFELKIDVEVDGDQHHLDLKIAESDKRRTDFLETLGWKVFRIKWSNYQKLSYEDKAKVIDDIRELLNENSEFNSSRNLVKEVEKESGRCVDCGKDIFRKSIRCRECSTKINAPKRRKFEVAKEELEKLIQEKPYEEIGKIFGVTGVSIKKRARKLGIILKNRLGSWTKINYIKKSSNLFNGEK